MDIQSLKAGFISYLQELEKNSGTSQEDTSYSDYSEVSIFTHAKEFKDFISDEYNVSPDVISMNVSDILKLEVVNGKLVDPEEKEQENIEDSENASEKQETPTMMDVMNLLMQDKGFQAQYDSDGNGEINQDEFISFQESAKNLDGNAENLSLDDIVKSSEEASKINTEEETKPETEEAEKPTEPEVEEQTPEPQQTQQSQQAQQPQQVQSAQQMSGGSSPNANVTPVTNQQETAPVKENKDYKNMSIEELENEQSSKQSEIGDIREEMGKIYSGENEEVKSAMDKEEETKEAYLEAVENDEKISQELKDDLKENLDAITKQEGVVNDLKQSLQEAENAVSDQQAVIADDEANISSIEAAIAALPESSDDPEVQSQIDAQKAELEDQKAKAEAKRDEDQRVLDEELIPARDNIKNEDLPAAEEELKSLEQEKEGLDKQILETCSTDNKNNIEQASQAYDTAKENVGKVQDAQLANKQKDLDSLQTDLDNITGVLNEKKAEQLKKDTKVSDSEYDGQELLDTIKNLGYPATTFFDRLCEQMGMDEKEVTDLLTEMSTSEKWGNGCVTPELLFAQICNESGCDIDAVGDNGAAVGLGQFHECAVDEVNNQFGTHYTYEDRKDPVKALEMMALLLRYDYTSTGNSTIGMYTKYASGNTRNMSIGEGYYERIQKKIGLIP